MDTARHTTVLISLVTLGITLAGSVRAAEPQDCTLKQYGSIDLIVTDDGPVLMPIQLNGKPAVMALTLGSAGSVLWKRAAEERQLRRDPTPAQGVRLGKQKLTETATLDSITLGSLTYGSGKILVAPRPVEGLTDTGPEATAGLLGADILSKVDFELDLARKKLNLFSQDHCAGQVVYWTRNYASAPLYRGPLGELYFPLELEGKRVQATLSVDAPFTTLSTDVTRRLYGFDETSPGIEVERDGDDVEYHYRAMPITAPGLTVKNARVQLSKPRKGCTLLSSARRKGGAGYDESCMGAYPMKLGRSVLQELRLYFATKEEMLYFSAADAGK
jgi:Aspartyl protease